MIDVSDGVIADLCHICESSGKGAEIEVASLPVSPAVAETARLAGADSLEWVLSGGEDYELLFTASPKLFPVSKKCYWMKLESYVRKWENHCRNR